MYTFSSYKHELSTKQVYLQVDVKNNTDSYAQTLFQCWVLDITTIKSSFSSAWEQLLYFTNILRETGQSSMDGNGNSQEAFLSWQFPGERDVFTSQIVF